MPARLLQFATDSNRQRGREREKNLSYMKQAYNSTLHMYLYLSSGRLVVVWWLLGACSSHPPSSSSSSSSGAVDLASQTLVPSPLLCALEFWEQLFFVIGHELFAATSGRQRHRDDVKPTTGDGGSSMTRSGKLPGRWLHARWTKSASALGTGTGIYKHVGGHWRRRMRRRMRRAHWHTPDPYGKLHQQSSGQTPS